MFFRNNAENYGYLALRLSVGIIFVMMGWGKLTNIEMISGLLASKGFFWPMLWGYVVALTEFIGGLGVIFGVFVRFFAQLLAIVMIVALLLVHVGGAFGEAIGPIALLGSTLALAFLGGGKWVATKKDWAWLK